jgi:WD40 repeat protein
LKGDGDAVRCLSLLSNGSIVSGSADKTIKIWDAVKGYACVNVNKELGDFVQSLLVL